MDIAVKKKLEAKIKSVMLIFAVMFFSVFLCVIGTGASQNEDKQEIYLPIIMYHSFLKDKALQNDYTVSPDVLKNDLQYFKDNGYTTVTVSDLADFVYNNKALPQKCVMLTFDDGYYNNYFYAFPLLKEYKAKAVISPIVKMAEAFTESEDISPTYGHITTENIDEMIESGLVEIQNHSYDMHSLSPRKGVSKKSGESYEDYKRLITEDISKAQAYLKENTMANPICFVYPFGEESKETLDIIKEMGFISTLTCVEKPNTITNDPESLFELGRYRRDGNESISALISRIESDYKGD